MLHVSPGAEQLTRKAHMQLGWKTMSYMLVACTIACTALQNWHTLLPRTPGNKIHCLDNVLCYSMPPSRQPQGAYSILTWHLQHSIYLCCQQCLKMLLLVSSQGRVPCKEQAVLEWASHGFDGKTSSQSQALAKTIHSTTSTVVLHASHSACYPWSRQCMKYWLKQTSSA